MNEMKIINDNDLQLRPIQLTEDLSIALPWYQFKEVLYYSEGEGTLPYDITTIVRMYNYLTKNGDVSIIEIRISDQWMPIGDATLSKEIVPIVIGHKQFRGKGIEKRVISLLLKRAKGLDWKQIKVNKIYSYNVASRKMFESFGFTKIENGLDEKGREYYSYKLILDSLSK